MFILGVVDFDDQWSFRYILPEHFMVNKLDLLRCIVGLCECVATHCVVCSANGTFE